MGSVSISIREYSGKVGTVSFNLGGVNAATADTALDAAETALQAAVDDLTLGEISRVTTTRKSAAVSNALPSSPSAQRQNKILVRYEDDVTNELGSVEIPVADLSAVTLLTNTDIIDLTAGTAMPALVTAIETHVKSKAGNAVSVIQALWVGRNL